MVDQKMLLNLLLLVLTSVAAVGGSVNVMENYEEHSDMHPDMLDEEEREEFYQYVKKQQQKEKFQNMNNAPVNNVGPNAPNAPQVNTSESFQAQVANVALNAPNAPQVNTSESFQVQVAPQVNANVSMNNGAPTLEGFTGGSFAAF